MDKKQENAFVRVCVREKERCECVSERLIGTRTKAKNVNNSSEREKN